MPFGSESNNAGTHVQAIPKPATESVRFWGVSR